MALPRPRRPLLGFRRLPAKKLVDWPSALFTFKDREGKWLNTRPQGGAGRVPNVAAISSAGKTQKTVEGKMSGGIGISAGAALESHRFLLSIFLSPMFNNC